MLSESIIKNILIDYAYRRPIKTRCFNFLDIKVDELACRENYVDTYTATLSIKSGFSLSVGSDKFTTEQQKEAGRAQLIRYITNDLHGEFAHALMEATILIEREDNKEAAVKIRNIINSLSLI